VRRLHRNVTNEGVYYVLDTDASLIGLGVVIQLELLSVIYCFKKLKKYLFDIKCLLRVDHSGSALTYNIGFDESGCALASLLKITISHFLHRQSMQQNNVKTWHYNLSLID